MRRDIIAVNMNDANQEVDCCQFLTIYNARLLLILTEDLSVRRRHLRCC